MTLIETSVRRRFTRLAAWAQGRFPLADVSHRWMADDLTSVDMCRTWALSPASLPTVGGHRIRPLGMSNGTAAAIVLRDLITREENPLAGILDPQRLNVRRSARQFIEAHADVARFLGDRAAALVGPTPMFIRPKLIDPLRTGRATCAAPPLRCVATDAVQQTPGAPRSMRSGGLRRRGALLVVEDGARRAQRSIVAMRVECSGDGRHRRSRPGASLS